MNNSYVSTVLKANADLPASVLVSVEGECVLPHFLFKSFRCWYEAI